MADEVVSGAADAGATANAGAAATTAATTAAATTANASQGNAQAGAAQVADTNKGDGGSAIIKATVAGKVEDATKGYWPNDWRQNIAGEDKDQLKQLERFGSPKALHDAYRALNQKISSGELKSGKLPDKPTAEQVAAYRKEHGVPETAEGYYEKMSLPDGLVIGEEDKPIVNEVLAAAHLNHAPPQIVNSMVAAYYKAREAEQSAQDDSDLDHKATSEDALRNEWGPEYRQNVNIVKNFLTSTFGEGAARILGARLADGKPLGNDPEVLRPLLAVARELNPVATVVGHAGAATPGAIDDRLVAIKKMMGDRDGPYWKGPEAQKLQDEFLHLTRAKERNTSRAA